MKFPYLKYFMHQFFVMFKIHKKLQIVWFLNFLKITWLIIWKWLSFVCNQGNSIFDGCRVTRELWIKWNFVNDLKIFQFIDNLVNYWKAILNYSQEIFLACREFLKLKIMGNKENCNDYFSGWIKQFEIIEGIWTFMWLLRVECL